MSQSVISLSQSKLLGIWQQLSVVRKVGLASILVAAVTGLVLLITWAQTPDYVAAFTDLQPEDGAAVVEYLKENNIPYEITGNGGTIRVPSQQAYEVRLALASQGLPNKGVVGFELFDTVSLGMTDFTQQVNYQRALEGELARTISSLTAVKSARVHLAIPQPTLFSEEEKSVTASVVIDLKPGQQLSQEQVRAISHLVSSAVEGLKPENLTIVDVNGRVLADGTGTAESAPVALSANQLEAQHALERNLEHRIEAMLENVLGPDKAVVGVTAKMNWDQVETESETYVPASEGSVVRSSRIITETYAGGNGAAGGIPGTASNIPDAAASYQTEISGTNRNGYQRTDETMNYELSRSVSHITPAIGQIKQLSISVMVDNITDTVTLDAIQQATISAAGIDTARGDVLTVSSVPFNRTVAEEQEAARLETQQQEFYLKLVQWGIIILVLGALFLVIRGMQRRLRPKPVPIVTEIADPRTTFLTEVSRVTSNNSSMENRALELPTIGPPTFDAEQQAAAEKAQILRQVQLMAKNRPETLAQIIQFWITEEASNA